jgi:hypothetical protein
MLRGSGGFVYTADRRIPGSYITYGLLVSYNADSPYYTASNGRMVWEEINWNACGGQVYYPSMSGGPEEYYENPPPGQPVSGRKLNREPTEYKAWVLPTRPRLQLLIIF